MDLEHLLAEQESLAMCTTVSEERGNEQKCNPGKFALLKSLSFKANCPFYPSHQPRSRGG